jgi:uncharacterized protein (DUF427 family)
LISDRLQVDLFAKTEGAKCEISCNALRSKVGGPKWSVRSSEIEMECPIIRNRESGDMMEKTIKSPGPDHPISIDQSASRVVVSVGGRVVADSRHALLLKEASYPPVLYIPRADVDMSLLTRTDHSTYCPYKGDCSYYSILPGGERSRNGIWTYENPYDAVVEIKDHMAFYPDRVDGIDVTPAA